MVARKAHTSTAAPAAVARLQIEPSTRRDVRHLKHIHRRHLQPLRLALGHAGERAHACRRSAPFGNGTGFGGGGASSPSLGMFANFCSRSCRKVADCAGAPFFDKTWMRHATSSRRNPEVDIACH